MVGAVETINPKLFVPVQRIENAAQRALGAMATNPNVPANTNWLVRVELAEIKAALYDLEDAVSSGETLTRFR